MARRETTEDLVRLFAKDSPGAEDSDIEYKRLEKVTDSTNGKRDIIKIASSMANSQGGTIIIGVGRDGDNLIFQPFPADTEIKRDLYHTARDNTSPSVDSLIDIRFDRAWGNHLLRIDVERTNEELIYFNAGSPDGFVPYKRVGDTTKIMSQKEVQCFTESRKSSLQENVLSQVIHCDLEQSHAHSFDTYNAPSGRALLPVEGDFIPVISTIHPLEGFHKSVFFSLRTSVDVHDINSLKELLNCAREDLGIGTYWNLNYGIFLDDRIFIGMSEDDLFEDLSNIRNTFRHILDSGTNPDGDHRPIILIVGDSGYGLFYIELYWKYGSIFRSRVGFVMDDIPFNPISLEEFFENVGSPPAYYNQEKGTKMIEVQGNAKITNPKPVRFPTSFEGDKIEHIEADNPYFGRENELRKSAEYPISDYILKEFCSIPRLVYDLDDVFYSEAGDDFYLNYIELVYENLMFGTFFINASCWGGPHVQAN